MRLRATLLPRPSSRVIASDAASHPSRDRRRSSTTCVTVIVAMTATLLAGCLADPLPDRTVRNFLLAWQQGRYADAAELTTGKQRRVVQALRSAKRELNARDLQMKIESVEVHGRRATSTFRVRMWLDGIGRRWTYQGHMQLRRRNGTWKVVWSPSVIHPQLRAGQELAVVTHLPRRAPVVGSDGRPLVRPTPVVTVGVRPSALSRPRNTLARLSRALNISVGRVRTLVRKVGRNSFVPVATMRRNRYQRIRARVMDVPGVRVQTGTLPLPRRPHFAQTVLGGLGALTVGAPRPGATKPGPVRLSGLQLAFRQRLSGTPGSKVVALQPNGRRSAVLATFTGRPSRPVHTTIDADVQRAAERALRGVRKPAALVAVEASTGKVLAVANRPVGSTFNRAFLGTYRPGSAFKVVVTKALLSQGFRAGALVPCPSKRIVNGRTFRNRRSDIPLHGTPSLREDFVVSCNTAFVGLSRKLHDGALRRAARAFGIGGQWDLVLATATGRVPKSPEGAAKAAASIGLGEVRVSPLAMALVAATVASGTWHPPVLVTKPRQNNAEGWRRIPPQQARTLRRLMRKAVQHGTAAAAAAPQGPPVHGTTGTAIDGDSRPHAWFLGFQGDVAIAVLVEDAGSGRKIAAPIAGAFFSALSPREVSESTAVTRAAP